MGEAAAAEEEEGCRPVKAVGDGFAHFFYVRPHVSSDEEKKDDERVVFVANVYRGGRRDLVPVDEMEACLRDTLEASCGSVDRIELLQSAGGGSTVAARVRFASRVGARALLRNANAALAQWELDVDANRLKATGDRGGSESD
ncbi:MAG: hypothetical protein AAF368_03605 [Planctomycetota bacterium]